MRFIKCTVLFFLLTLPTLVANAQLKQFHQIIVPESSRRDITKRHDRAYTNILIAAQPASSYPVPGSETPASIACIYQLVPQVAGCPISGTSRLPSGNGRPIFIVDAYHDANAANDLAVFSAQFGLPAANLTVLYASGSQPSADSTGNWELEESIDIEYAHAMSPNSPIYLVEAASDLTTDLYTAVQYASTVASPAGGVVSMSWTDPESSGENSHDDLFNTVNVSYFASSGDIAFEHSYPAMSPNVTSVGGTTIIRDANGNFLGESYWDNTSNGSGGGGGISSYEARPSYQQSVSSIVGNQRGGPDMAAIADPDTGAAYYDSTPYSGPPYYGTAPQWAQIGGTSLAAPIIAARIANIGFFNSSASFLSGAYAAYTNGTYSTYFRDVTQGASSSCTVGWDICTGLGSLLGSSFPVLNPNQGSADYGDFQNSSSREKVQTFTFTNSNVKALDISSAGISSQLGSGPEFNVTSNSCSGSINPNASCTITVTCDPSNAGGSGTETTVAILEVQHNGWNSPSTIALQGTMTCGNNPCSK